MWYNFRSALNLFHKLPVSKQISAEVQYSPSEQEVVARHVEVVWQVRGLPIISSLQDVRPVTVKQSDLRAQMTKKNHEI